MIDVKDLEDIQIGNADTVDYPDFADAYLVDATIATEHGGVRNLTDDELDYVNDNHSDWVQEQALLQCGDVVDHIERDSIEAYKLWRERQWDN